MGKRKTKQERKKKVTLVFDENKRKDYLCGFRKRKLERKKKAQEDIQRLMKDEVKRIKQENKESYKKLVVSSRPLPDIEQLLQDEYEDDDVNVKIVELSSDTLQKTNLFIGENKPKPDKVVKEVKKNKKVEHITEIPGMGSDEEEDEEESEDNMDTEGKSKKEIKNLLKKQATKKIQKSKVFQMKSKLDRIQNKKKSRQKKEHMKKGAAKAKGHRNNPRGDGTGTNNVREVKGKGKKTVDRRRNH